MKKIKKEMEKYYLNINKKKIIVKKKKYFQKFIE